MQARGGREPAVQRRPLSEEYLRRRYLRDGLSSAEIAAETGWSSQRVRDWLRSYGIAVRPRGIAKTTRLSRDELQGWLDAGWSVRKIADQVGYSTSGVHKAIAEFGLTRPERVRPPLADQRLLDELAAKYAAGVSLEALGAQYGHSNDWARNRLIAAGVDTRSVGRRRSVSADKVRRALDEGLRVAEIAERLNCSTTTVQQVLRDNDWQGPPPRPCGPSRGLPAVPSALVLRSMYVDQQMTVAQMSQALGISTTRVTGALKRHGIVLRRSGWTGGRPPPLIAAQHLQEMYVRVGKTIGQTARALGTTETRVRSALRAHRIPIRPEPRIVEPLDLDTEQLTELYVHRRLDDDEIAELMQVPPWRVRRRRRELRVHRPAGSAPRSTAQAPPAGQLRELYLGQGLTLADIGRHLHTSAPRVRQWLVDAGIPVAPRTTRATRTTLDVEQLRALYQDRQWTSVEIAAHLDVTPALVRRTLHENNIPVRRGPSRRPVDQNAARLTALYQDPDVVALLHRHGIPRREAAGSLAERFPHPAAVTPAFLVEGYEEIGLSAEHLEQLTGHPAERILAELRAHGIPVRPGASFSPWHLRRIR